MEWFYKTAAVIGTITLLTTVIPAVQAHSLQSRANPTELAKLFEGQTKAKRRDLQGAIVAYTQAIEANSKYTKAYLYRGLVYHDLGDYRKAITDFEQAVRIEPKNH